MKNLTLTLLLSSSLLLSGCNEEVKPKNSNKIYFSTSAEYPPFEYHQNGILKGFDIELAKLIAHKLGKEAAFLDMQFSTILPAISSQQADAAIATLTITEERKKNFDFTIPYYFEEMAVVFKKDVPIKDASQLVGKKIAVQLGTTMEYWLKKNAQDNQIIAMDTNNQAIEALKGGHVELVVIDGPQAVLFSKKNPSLSYSIIAKANDGYGIALPKDSALTIQMNHILAQLKETGELDTLQKTWLGNMQ